MFRVNNKNTRTTSMKLFYQLKIFNNILFEAVISPKTLQRLQSIENGQKFALHIVFNKHSFKVTFLEILFLTS